MRAYLRSVFSEDDGQGSYARVASFVSLLAAISWVSLIVWKTKTIPPLSDLTLFITSAYGVNKLHAGITSVFGK